MSGPRFALKLVAANPVVRTLRRATDPDAEILEEHCIGKEGDEQECEAGTK